MFLGGVCLYFLLLMGVSLYLKVLFLVCLHLSLWESLFLLVQGGRQRRGRVGFPLTFSFGKDVPFREGLGFFRGLTGQGLRFALREKSKMKLGGFIGLGRRGGRLSGLRGGSVIQGLQAMIGGNMELGRGASTWR